MVVNNPVDAQWFKRVSVDDDRNAPYVTVQEGDGGLVKYALEKKFMTVFCDAVKVYGVLMRI